MRSLWAAGLLLRRIRSEPGMMLLLFLAIAATSFVFAGAPRLFNRVSDDAVRSAMTATTAGQRNVVLAQATRLDPGEQGGVTELQADGDRLAEKLPASLAALISERSLYVTTARLHITKPLSVDSYLTLRYQDGLTDATRLDAGRWPSDKRMTLPPAEVVGQEGPGAPGPMAPVVIEAAFSSADAAAIGIQLGDRLPVRLDGTDPLLDRIPYQLGVVEIEVVGLYHPVDPAADYWSGDASLRQLSPGRVDPGLGMLTAYVTAYVPADAYPGLYSSGLPFHYEWHFHVDPQRLDAGQVTTLQADLRHLDFAVGASDLASPGEVVARTGLLPILDGFAAQLAASESMLSVAAIGPFALAGGVLGMLAVMLITRRRAALSLARGRGASGTLVLGTQLWEAIVLGGAASLVGLLAAVTVVGARDSSLSPMLSVAVAGLAVLLLLGASWRTTRRPVGQFERDDPPGLRVAPRRLIIELTIVGIAAAGALILRQRGLTVDGGGGNRFNPLLGAVPVLSGLAAGILAMRLYPLPVRAVGWLAARRRDLIPVLGLRTIGRHPATANVVLLVLMLTAAFGAFSSVIVTSIDHGQVITSYLAVGADFRIEKVGIGALAPSGDTAAVPGVEAVASGIIDKSAPFASLAGQRASILLEAVDPRQYADVAAGSAAEPDWPAAFLAEPAGAGLGTDRNPIPAILSPDLPSGSADLAPGDTFQARVRDQTMTFRLVEQRSSFAGIGSPASFAIVPFNWVQAAFTDGVLPPSVLWVRAPEDVRTRLAANFPAAAGGSRIISRYDAYATLHAAPLVAAIANGYALALLVAAAYMALAIIGAVVLSAARRTQDLAYLRTLGVSVPQALALAIVEHGPPVLLALIPGVALGIGIAFLIEPGLGLAPFVGTSGLPLFVDWSTMALMGAALVGVVAVAVLAGTWLSHRARLVDALRIGED